ncbi:hypothetical protein SEA_MOSSY_75 [Gordonia phage Mossy]|nr:hypothetical protein SEA_MOSSY_75 [Gordonia phage Mossy]
MNYIAESVPDQPADVIRLAVGRPPHAECSCGWKTEPSEKLHELASQAFDHSAESGHALRKHEGSDVGIFPES